MIKKIVEKPEIYVIDIPLPNNPLRNLNCYVMKSGKETLIIDTGFNKPECLEALKNGISELEIDMDYATLYLTHLHSDHTGLANKISTDKTRIIMSTIEYEYLKRIMSGEIWKKSHKEYLAEGFSKADVEAQNRNNPAMIFGTKNIFEAVTLEDGESFTVGEYEFEMILVPGHTPGNTCLYLKDQKILFSGDHILFDISPNITRWPDVERSLENYLDSLDKIAGYEINMTLPAHRRRGEEDVYARIAALKKHHQERLNNIINIIEKKDYQTAFEIAGQLPWSLRGKSWEECPVSQKWFATGETMSHLDLLVNSNRIVKVFDGQCYQYRTK